MNIALMSWIHFSLDRWLSSSFCLWDSFCIWWCFLNLLTYCTWSVSFEHSCIVCIVLTVICIVNKTALFINLSINIRVKACEFLIRERIWTFKFHWCSSLLIAVGRKLVSFLNNLASSVNHEAFGRVGLMAFSVCIASASEEPLLGRGVEVSPDILGLCSMSSGGSNLQGVLVLVDTLRIVIEKSKHHFNPKYRLRGGLLIILT